MRNTGVFVGLRALRDIISDQIAVDRGSATTAIWVSGERHARDGRPFGSGTGYDSLDNQAEGAK